MSSSKFGAPRVGQGTDFGKLGKLAQRVEQTLHEYVVFTEPKQLDPASVLVAPLNRDGAPPNVPHIHSGILRGFLEGVCFNQAPGGHLCGVQVRGGDK